MFKKEIVKALAKAGIEKALAEQLIEIPQNRENGDYAFPCFRLAKEFKKNPVEIASELAEKILLPKNFSKKEAKGPYINFFVNKETYAKEIIEEALGKNTKAKSKGAEEKIIVEYCQANPMKAFHIGHVRNICLGESIARLFESQGKKVVRVDYGGDVGPHVSKTLYAYREMKHEKEPIDLIEKEKWLGSLYAMGAKEVKENPELEEKMREMVVELEQGKNKGLVKDWKELRAKSITCFKRIFKELNVKFDNIILESEVEKDGIKIANQLYKEGFAVKDQGALLVDLTEYNLEKFLILKSDGAALYSSKDLGLAKMKKKALKAKKTYNIVGSEQQFYFKQLVKTIELLNKKKNEYCETIPVHYELVRLEGGKMASREGNVITYTELFDTIFEKILSETKERHKEWSKKKLKETAKDITMAAIKFGMLSQDKNKVITFNWEKATSVEGETGPFVLYSYARANSILRKAGKVKKPKKFVIENEKEAELISNIGSYRKVLKDAAENNTPHKIAHYLLNLASTFNSFYHESQVLESEKEIKETRVALVEATANTLKKAAEVLNIKVVEEM